jgi:glycosyltransferase involved in cell wall biosynthesis
MQKKILFVYTNFSTFVRTDFEILSEVYQVKKYQYKPVKGLGKNVLEFTRQLFYLLFNIWRYDAVFIWFADYHSFLPVLFARITGRKSFVVIGGYDVARIPELKYGVLLKPIRRFSAVFSLRYASYCLPVVEQLEERIKEICPSAKTKTIYTGYKLETNKTEIFENNREKIILTVSITDSEQRMLIKGLDRFRELAVNMPDFNFIIVGVKENSKYLFEPKPQNLVLLPPLNQNELTEHFLKASFYAQLSRSEGLPNALCEAMVHGCIPLGTNIGGIPSAIGNYGLIMDQWDCKAAASFILSNHNTINRSIVKRQIFEKFDLKFREEELKRLI